MEESEQETLDIIKEENVSEEEGSEEEESNIINNKKNTKLHTIASKLKIIKFAKENTRKEACIKYNIPLSTLGDWIRSENNFINVPTSHLNKKTIHKGPKILYPELEIKIIQFIEFNRKLFNPISTWALLLKLFEIEPERKNKSIKSNQLLIYRILKRNGYSYRTKTHIGQGITKDCFLKASLFLKEVWDKRIDFGFFDYLIANMDETPLSFNMIPTKTIAKKGTKSIIIKTLEQEKLRVSVLLTITADGGRLPPYIIFKAKRHGKIEKELQKDIYVKNKKCVIACNDNAWATEDIIIDWVNKIWNPYLIKDNICNEENMGYLIIDQATSHITSNVLNFLKGPNRDITYIPGGLTRFLQPLDVVINKPFKENLRELYISHCINNGENNIKISRSKMIDFICTIWYDMNKITKDMIYNSFRATGIANKINHSEDHLFSAWKKMESENPLLEDDLENDYHINNEEINDEDDDIEI